MRGLFVAMLFLARADSTARRLKQPFQPGVSKSSSHKPKPPAANDPIADERNCRERFALKQHPGGAPRCCDLGALIHAQLRTLGIGNRQVQNLELDTLSSVDWHSYRRDRDSAGRNLSLIVAPGRS